MGPNVTRSTRIATSLRETSPMFQASQIANHMASLLKLTPILAFLVYDGLEQDIPATTILKRVLSSAEVDSPVLQHCANFLCSAMVKFCKSDVTVEVDLTTIMAQPPMLAKKWAHT
eukprot:9268843-Ditylum_brightwellii.AAC.1